MNRWKKPLIIGAVCLSVLLLLVLVFLHRYHNGPWGFSREVSEQEASARLSLVDSATQWLGCEEADGSHCPIIDLYNTQQPLPMGYQVQYTDSWCATFVTAAAMDAGLSGIIPAECGCQRQVELFRELGCWQEQDTYFPQPGDIIYYAWDEKPTGDCTGWADHVGIVVGTCWPFIRVIEGNMDDRVGYRTLSIWNSTIRGYGLPEYNRQNVPSQ